MRHGDVHPEGTREVDGDVAEPGGKRSWPPHAGAFFGEGALAGQRRRTGTAKTVTASTIAMVKTGEMRRGLHEEWRFRLVSVAVAARNIRIEADWSASSSTAVKRLARSAVAARELRRAQLPRAALPLSPGSARRDDRDVAVEGRRADEQVPQARIPRAPQRTRRRHAGALLDAERRPAGVRSALGNGRVL